MLKNVTVYPWDFGTAMLTDTHGGQQLTINIDHDIVEDLRWLREYRSALSKEIALRQENTALNSAWEQYQTILNLVILDQGP